MSVNVDAVNERLNGLVTLLKAVGIDSLDKSSVDRVSKNLAMAAAQNNRNGKGGNSNGQSAAKLDDEQIEAIIRKLQMAQPQQSESTPQIIAALEAAASASKGRPANQVRRNQKHYEQEEDEEEEEEDEEEEEEDDDDDEDDDELDEDANYPMVGHGVSDDISVVSDLTTPTVVSSLNVPEEENYRDTLPPMIIGGGAAPPMMIAPTKRKNLVGSVRPQSQSMQHQRPGGHGIAPPSRRGDVAPARPVRASAPTASGGAAASRRKTHTAAMDKLGNNSGSNVSGAVRKPAPVHSQQQRSQRPTQRSHSPKRSSSPKAQRPSVTNTQQQPSLSQPRRGVTRKASLDANTSFRSADGHSSIRSNEGKTGWDNSDWNAFADTTNNAGSAKPKVSTKAVKKSPAPATVIDNDGFLIEPIDPTFDPFNTASVAAKAQSQYRSSSSNPSQQQARSTQVRKKKPSSGTPSGAAPSNERATRRMSTTGKGPVPSEKRRVRRASMDH
jgi:hypothetical protein